MSQGHSEGAKRVGARGARRCLAARRVARKAIRASGLEYSSSYSFTAVGSCSHTPLSTKRPARAASPLPLLPLTRRLLSTRSLAQLATNGSTGSHHCSVGVPATLAVLHPADALARSQSPRRGEDGKPFLPGCTASVRVDGELAPIYSICSSGNKVTGYIEAKEGARYQVEFYEGRRQAPLSAYLAHLYLDGRL